MKTYLISTVIIGACITLFGCRSAEPPTQIWEHDQRGLFAASLSGDGRYMLMASVEKSAQLYDLNEQALVYTWNHTPGQPTDYSHVMLSDNGRIAVTVEPAAIGAWDTETGKSRGFWRLPGHIIAVSLSAKGRYVMAGLAGNKATVLDLKRSARIRDMDTCDVINSVDISKDASLGLVACDDGQAQLFRISDGKLLGTWGAQSRITFASISSTNKYVLISEPYEVLRIYDAESGKRLMELTDFPGFFAHLTKAFVNVKSARFSEDDRYLITGSPPRNVRVWDLENGKLLKKWWVPKHSIWKPTSAIIYAVTFSADGQSVIAEASNGMGYRWPFAQ